MKRCVGAGAFLAVATIVLVGCVPGESVFTFRTSELRKALNGETATAVAHIRGGRAISNASERVFFGGGRFTNRLDVARRLVNQCMHTFDHKRLPFTTNENCNARMWIEEGAVPELRIEGDVGVLIVPKGKSPRPEEFHGFNYGMVLCLSEDGGFVRYEGTPRDWDPVALKGVMGAIYAEASLLTLQCIFSKSEMEMFAPIENLFYASVPTWYEDVSCEIVGDDEEGLGIEARDVEVDGVRKDRFSARIAKGQRIRFKIDKEKHRNAIGLRFLK